MPIMKTINDKFPGTSERGKSATQKKHKAWRDGILVIEGLVPPTAAAAAAAAKILPGSEISLQDMQKFRSNNQTGWKGVVANHNKFRATFKKNGNTTYLGNYGTPEQAARAYAAYCIEHGDGGPEGDGGRDGDGGPEGDGGRDGDD